MSLAQIMVGDIIPLIRTSTYTSTCIPPTFRYSCHYTRQRPRNVNSRIQEIDVIHLRK